MFSLRNKKKNFELSSIPHLTWSSGSSPEVEGRGWGEWDDKDNSEIIFHISQQK